MALLKGATMAVVEIADQLFLIGATEHSVEVLAELDPEMLGTEAEAELAPSPISKGPGPWMDLFNRALKARGIERPSKRPGHDF